MGMTLKAMMGTTGTWIDVTPATKTGVEHISEAEERGIQRDFKRFVKKALGRMKKHLPRETHIIRIPAAATDGYFRLVLCSNSDGKKVLCGSPVFRIASTSTDVSTVRGSSLSTMPLEMGIKVASTIGSQVAKKYTGVAGAVVEQGAKRLTPSNATIKKVATKAYHGSGIGNAVSESWKNGKAGRYDPLISGEAMEPLTILGSGEGPEAPFPFKFAGKVVRGTGISTRELDENGRCLCRMGTRPPTQRKRRFRRRLARSNRHNRTPPQRPSRGSSSEQSNSAHPPRLF
ncbi:putative CDP-alcohol phosphatidyltransferase class-I family protein C22A12.10 [Fusarium oxysporum f. sp. albedinis]|nr:putative CDP-alcohol phosphatidyltransferase class-I family protein C22A12.10 [Fusarium oxysporum f. sp. albedinis]